MLRRKVTVFFSEHRAEEIFCVPGTFLYFIVPAVSQEKNVDLQMRERLRELLCVGMNLKSLVCMNLVVEGRLIRRHSINSKDLSDVLFPGVDD